ncbi:MAG: hypothetical protein IT195_10095 [Microthrixaceae bacterium]|nr:hypothetical protein [Microthrixaceae bacterium]
MSVTIRCPVCGDPFAVAGRRRYCSNACRQAAWRLRRATPPQPASRLPKSVIVYQCPNCETRYLGEQHCPDCNTFCRRLGPGGPCPHCDEPITITDLTP